MGKVNILTAKQKFILEQFKKDRYLRQKFYFTGGTALSTYYLKHRFSVDLDFFSTERFSVEDIIKRLNVWVKLSKFVFEYSQVHDVYIFILTFRNKEKVKIDFNFYPFKQVKKTVLVDGIRVDSLLDIAVNKLLTVKQRTEVKDFVDLYFLLKKFTIWDLIDGLKVKFNIKTEPVFLSSDLMKVEQFKILPKMIEPLKLDTLKAFFKERAKVLGGKAVN